MNVMEAFEKFEVAATEARGERGGTSKKEAMAKRFQELLTASGETKRSIQRGCIAGRASIDRWVAGTSAPHPSHVRDLETYLLGIKPPKSGDFTYLANDLLDLRFRSTITFLLAEEVAGRNLDKEQLSKLLWLAEQSKSPPSVEMMRTFLGIST